MRSIQKKRLLRCTAIVLAAGACAAGALYILSWFPSVQLCVFHRITGLSCPGCGNTRAATALLHLRFAESFTYNYAYPVEFMYILLVAGSAAVNYIKNGKFRYSPKYPAADYTLLALLLIWGVVRNVIGV